MAPSAKPAGARSDAAKKRRQAEGADAAPAATATHQWAARAASDIDAATDPAKLRSIMSELGRLVANTQSRLTEFESATGTGVVLVDSNQSQDQDMDNNMCSRSVEARFTVGPKRAPLTFEISNQNTEGDEEVSVECDIFTYESDPFQDIDDFTVSDTDEIANFLTAAGLENARPMRGCAEDIDALSDEERHKWVVADVVHDVIEQLEGKYGREDNCGVALGCDPDWLYGRLGLDYVA